MTAIVSESGIDTGAPWHYGDPMREQRILETAAGVIDRSNRPVLAISGPDRLPWLHSICSQHVSNLADGESTEALVLSPHGHVEQHWQLTERDDTVWLDVEPGMADDALGYLQKMRFLKRVEPSDVSDEWAVIGLVGPAADAVLVAAGHTPPTTRAIAALPAGGFARRTPWGDVDLVVLPPPCPLDVSVLNFGRAGELIRSAYATARAALGADGGRRQHPEQEISMHVHPLPDAAEPGSGDPRTRL